MSEELNNTTAEDAADAEVETTQPAVATEAESPSDAAADTKAASADVSAESPAEPAADVDSETSVAETEDDEADDDEADDDEADDDAPVAEASLEGVIDSSGDAGDDLEDPDESKRDWYILKVQSNRENSISEALLRRVKIEGLEGYFGEIIVPTEKVSEFKGGKKRVVKRKLYPGYIVVNMQITDDTWFLVRETPGIGDFTGAAGKPTPMLPHEIAKIIELDKPEEEQPEKLNIRFKVGDRVKINVGTFENFEGDVDAIDESSGRVTVMINIFGRSTPAELEHWQIETI